jgi:hypothetical protein
MARRKRSQAKKSPTRRKRRYRVGAMNTDSKNLLMQTIGGIGGAVIGSYVGSAIQKQAEKMSSLEPYAQYVNGGVQLIGGYLVPMLIKQKSPILNGFASGMMMNGGLEIIKASGILPGVAGVGAMNDYSVPMIAATPMMNNRMITEERSKPVSFVAGTNTKMKGAMNHA